MFFAKIAESIDILIGFFSSEPQGLTKDYLQSSDKYKQLKKYLKLQTLETPRLISLYYQEMIAIQNSLKSSDYGSILCQASFHSKDNTLVVEGCSFFMKFYNYLFEIKILSKSQLLYMIFQFQLTYSSQMQKFNSNGSKWPKRSSKFFPLTFCRFLFFIFLIDFFLTF